MRKALLERFILVLLAALCINSVIFYIASSKMMLKNSKNDMTYTIKAVDSILDYDRDLMEQMERLEAFTDQDSSRVTLIKSDGTVVTDSDADAEYLDNHQGREEIQAAMEHGGVLYLRWCPSIPLRVHLCKLRYGVRRRQQSFQIQSLSCRCFR